MRNFMPKNRKSTSSSPLAGPWILCVFFLFLIFDCGLVFTQNKPVYQLGPQRMPSNTGSFHVVKPGEGIPMYDPVTGNLNTSCTNSNFSLGNWTGWAGCYGYGTNPPLNSCQNSGLLTGPPYPANYTVPLHKIMPAPGHKDYWGCNVVNTVFPGEDFSARLGDTTTGRHGAELHYDLYVDSLNYLFVYRYAVVLESPNHPVERQPNFQVVIRDSAGNTLDPVCGYYYIAAPSTPNTPPPGWTWCNTYGRSRYARPWTTVGMDLTPYVGRNITLAFIAKGCCIDGGSHRGYAFVSAYCSSLIIQTAMCEGDTSATLTAPPGFAHYLWSTGDTTESITVPHPVTGATYSALLTAYNNCTVTLTMTLTYTVVHANFNFVPNCPGSPSVFTDSSTVNQNQVVGWTWDWGDGSPVAFTNVSSAAHSFANPGNYQVKMVAHSTEGCTDTITKSVTIDTLAVITNNPMMKTICSGDHVNLNLTSNVNGATFTWLAVAQHPSTTTGYHDNNIPSVFLDDTIQNSGLVADTVSYFLRSHNNTCTGPEVTYQVIVLPKPSLANTVLSQSVCSGSASAAVTLNPLPGPPAVVTFNWTAYPSSPLLTGYVPSASGTLSIPAQTIINNTGTQQYVDDSIIPYLQGPGACVGDKKAYRIYINTLPTPVISGPASVCAGSSSVVYSSPLTAGHSYLWTVTGASSFTGNGTNAITVNWGTGPLGTVILQETDISQPTNCSSTTSAFNVTINPNPVPVISGSSSPCGLSTATYTLGNPQTGHSYQWTVSGGSPSAGNNSSISVTWGNTNPISISATETIAYSGGVNCSAIAPAFPLNLITFPLPAGPISGTSPVCNTWTRTFTVSPVTNADSYTWWYLPAADVLITNNGNSADVSFGTSASSGNLYVTGNKTGCGSGPASPPFPVIVNPLPYISLSACNDPKTTATSRPFYLKGGVPPGGQYLLDGMPLAGGLIDPASLSTTTHQITYRFTDMNSCTSTSAPVSLTVIPGSTLTVCPLSITDPRNGKIYRTTRMGGRCWMLQNLDYGTRLDPATQPQTDNCQPEKYCSPSDASCTASGGFYQWDELMQYRTPGPGEYLQGLCPPEWHVPTAAEWQMLIDAQSNPGNGIAGGDLKDPNPAFGFRALLSGIYYQNESWNFVSGVLTGSMFWTSSLSNGGRVIARGLNNKVESVSFYHSLRSNAYPVRCVKDF
jgi:uncharacterized protein (TIGR02145 family)